jgi:hypothetical protein
VKKLQLENPGQKLQIRLENLGLLVSGGESFYIPSCRKSKGEKIPASNYRYGQKIPWTVTSGSARKSQPITMDWIQPENPGQ